MLTSEYIFLVLGLLNNKQSVTSDQILFDYNTVLEALIRFANKNVERFISPSIKGISKFVALYKTDKKKFSGYNSFQSKYLD